jgi:hypothetical protein
MGAAEVVAPISLTLHPAIMKTFNPCRGAACTALLPLLLLTSLLPAQKPLRFDLSEDGRQYFQVTFLNQTWLRLNRSNPGTLADGVARDHTFDIGLRRTRIQMFGQVYPRVFLYFQFGQNNFNPQFAVGGNRKVAAFFHDAVCEYDTDGKGLLKLGAGLTIANGLSRFSQPSIGTIMTMDVPVFIQSTVDQTDGFSRKLSVYARGQWKRFDYRFILSDPFPITSSGAAPAPFAPQATFSRQGRSLQYQGWLAWQFFDHEPHTTPYMTGTYLGKRKVWNVAVGAISQPDATWRAGAAGDTLFDNMLHWAVESYLDMPLDPEKGSAVSAYAGFFSTNYGKDYLRFNGIMNPANATAATDAVGGSGSTYGNALPMFGTGRVVYLQAGWLLPRIRGLRGQLMPYASATLARYDRLGDLPVRTWNAGINWLLAGHGAKLSLDLQNRPTFTEGQGIAGKGPRRNQVVLQYQISI